MNIANIFHEIDQVELFQLAQPTSSSGNSWIFPSGLRFILNQLGEVLIVQVHGQVDTSMRCSCLHNILLVCRDFCAGVNTLQSAGSAVTYSILVRQLSHACVYSM